MLTALLCWEFFEDDDIKHGLQIGPLWVRPNVDATRGNKPDQSGTTTQRLAFAQMQKAIFDGRVKTVVV